jgi:flagellar hook-basal body complex protein FliE
VISNIGTNSTVAIERLRPENFVAPRGDELNPSTPLGVSDAPLRIANPQPSEVAPHSGFANVIDRAVQEVDGKMKAAAAEQARVLTGETNNLHQAMISMQEASVAFSLMVEVRNKLVESYQELMRMQI